LKKRLKHKEGFLIFELMVAVVILSISLTVISRSFFHALSALQSSEHFLKGGLLLEKKIWELEQKKGSSGEEEGTFPEMGEVFHWAVQQEATENPPLYRTSVQVSWETHRGKGLLTTETYFPKDNEE